MAIVSEKPHAQRLKKLGTVILTEFWDGSGRRRIRVTDGSRRDDVRSGAVLSKEYSRDGAVLRRETAFSPMMTYTYVAAGVPEAETECPNCGWHGTAADFEDGCPYCGTCCNVEYAERRAGGKFHADRDKKDVRAYLVPLAACLAVCLSASFLLTALSARTFNAFDAMKALLAGLLPALALFALYYACRAYFFGRRTEEEYRQETLRLQRFESDLKALGMRLDEFYTNLDSELSRWCYDDSVPENRDVVDFDVLDYDGLAVAPGGRKIDAVLLLRRVRAANGRCVSGRDRLRLTLRLSDRIPDALGPGANILSCYSCGASIDGTKPACPHCGARINYRQRMYLTDVGAAEKARRSEMST